jgi:hypothetical protein
MYQEPSEKNDNTKDRTKVQPDPIQLYPSVATPNARQLDRVDFADRVIGTFGSGTRRLAVLRDCGQS